MGVNPLPGYKLNVRFDDGVSGDIELKSFIANGIFKVLQAPDLFDKVYTTGYSVAWSDELEIDALTIYAELLKKSPQEIFTTDFNYAAN
jgi:hypothetical protein